MSFLTNWEPDDVFEDITKKIADNSHNLRNIGKDVTFSDDGRGGYNVKAKSYGGVLHDTKIKINIKKNPDKGSTVTISGLGNTDSQEAQVMEDSIKDLFFKD